MTDFLGMRREEVGIGEEIGKLRKLLLIVQGFVKKKKSIHRSMVEK